ncbi:MAG: MxaK protein [Burkholderiales bacterium]|nr:MxaK protein [Burkholderiales bacterium]
MIRPRWLAVLLAALAIASAVDGLLLWQAQQWNRVIAGGVTEAGEMAAGALPPEAGFAEAYRAGRAGDLQTALNLYKRVEQSDSLELSLAARYNSGNLYLEEALELRDSDGEKNALPMAELAKESYRGVLRRDSRYWDAKYNLERALRAFPDSAAQSGLEPPEQAERAITTMRGFTLGLP